MAVRTLVVWCPDWPVVAAGATPERPVAVLAAGRVEACSAAARAEGVRRGLRRREAQSRCPDLDVLEHDPSRDARAFEPVLAAVEALAPGVEVIRPGLAAVSTRGPARYFGGDAALATLVAGTVADLGIDARVGIADGPFAAGLAARHGVVVPPGGSAAFLAPYPIETIDRPELADLLRRLGLGTLGDFAALPGQDVLARFGPDGALAHRLARGRDERRLIARIPPADLAVQIELDPPVERVDTAAFAAKTLAERLHEKLARCGLACTRIGIEVQTEHGERLVRRWRHDGGLSATAVAERIRWQLDGWLSGTLAGSGGTPASTPGVIERPTTGLILLRLVPEQVVPDGQQLDLWGSGGEAGDAVARALARVQGLLGPDAVATAVPAGGRGPAERVRLVRWGDPRDELASTATLPWPGRLPAPAPATVPVEPLPAAVQDRDGRPVGVTDRYAVTAPPTRLSVSGGPWLTLSGWAGPWPVDERWWEPAAHRRRARFQTSTDTGAAFLLTLEDGCWWVEAVYD